MIQITGQTLSLATKLLGIQAIASLVVFFGVAAICKLFLELDPLLSAIIAMFSAFGTLVATWNIGK